MKNKQSGMEQYNQERKENAEKRRQHVLNTAQGLFYKKGIINVSMNEIMHEAGVSKGTIYRYFKNIDEIAFELQYSCTRTVFEKSGEILSGKDYEKIARDFNLYLIDSFYKYKKEYQYIGMFDNMYSGKYPNEQMGKEYFNYISHIGNTDFLELMNTSREVFIKMVTITNVTLSFLYRMASRGELLANEQKITIDEQLQEYRNMILRDFD